MTDRSCVCFNGEKTAQKREAKGFSFSDIRIQNFHSDDCLIMAHCPLGIGPGRIV